MCGGASKMMTRDLPVSYSLANHLVTYGLGTLQSILDEGERGLEAIGIEEENGSSLIELIYQKIEQAE